MAEEDNIPLLLDFLFGEAADTAQQGASDRLLRWAEAFDEWIAERGRNYKPDTTKQSKLALRRMLREQRKMPWALSQEDIEQHRDWMAAEGYAASTIYNALRIIANFFNWCDERQIDPECEAGFNPAAGVKRPRIKRYDGVQMLSRGEVRALLGITRQDESALVKRDHAFILARLRIGVPLKALRELRWGQVVQVKSPQRGRCDGDGGDGVGELGREGAWVQWREGAQPAQLPGEVWQAILDYLKASGRLGVMVADDYIFTPLAEPGTVGEKNRAQDWVAGRPVSQNALLESLKIYGRVVGIPEAKLTMRALRRTATRLRMDEGEGLEGMRVFLDSQEAAGYTEYRLAKLPQLPEDVSGGEVDEFSAQLPDRKAKPIKPGDGLIHGYYANSHPEAEVLAVIAEDIQGIEGEIAGLRRLARGLVARQKAARSGKEIAQLADTHTRAASRVAEMIAAEEQMVKEGEEDTWAENMLEMLDKMAISNGEEPPSEDIRAAALESEPELGITARRLVEEIATTRYMLRNVLAAALETGALAGYLRMVEIYGGGCVRLVRMLKREERDHGQLRRYLEEGINQAINEVLKEWGR
jgi:hypothetical protein